MCMNVCLGRAGRVNPMEMLLIQQLQQSRKSKTRMVCGLVALHWASQKRDHTSSPSGTCLPQTLLAILKVSLAAPPVLTTPEGGSAFADEVLCATSPKRIDLGDLVSTSEDPHSIRWVSIIDEALER